MSGKTPRREAHSPAQGQTRQDTRSKSALSDRSESPGHSDWKNNAEKGKSGAKTPRKELTKTNSGTARSTGGQTPRSGQKTPRGEAKTPRTPRSRTPRSGTPTSGMSDDGAMARMPLYMQPTYASMNKSRKPPPRTATLHTRGMSSDETGARAGGRGAGARQDSRSPVLNKSWTSGNTTRAKSQPRRPTSASSESAVVGEGIIPKGHVGGRASPLPADRNGLVSTPPPPSPSAKTAQEKSPDQAAKKTSPVKKKPAPLVVADSEDAGKTTTAKTPVKKPLAKRSPPTPTGVKTPPAKTPVAKKPAVATKSPKPVSKSPIKEDGASTVAKGKGKEKEKAATPPPPPAVCEVTPAEDDVVSPAPQSVVEEQQQNKAADEPQIKKSESMAKTVKRKLFGCMAPNRKSVSYD